MTDYADVPAVNALHQESERIASAQAMLAAGGTMVNFTIAPALGEMSAGPVMPVGINVPEALPPQLIAGLSAWLTQRQGEIAAQLAGLGVS